MSRLFKKKKIKLLACNHTRKFSYQISYPWITYSNVQTGPKCSPTNCAGFSVGLLFLFPTDLFELWLLAEILPFLLQIVIWLVIPAAGNSSSEHNNNTLAMIILIQYIPRLYLIFPSSYEIIKATGVVAKTAWLGAAYNLLLYLIASHVRYFRSLDHLIC